MSKRIVALVNTQGKQAAEQKGLIVSKYYNNLLTELFSDMSYLQDVINSEFFADLYTYKPNYTWQTECTIIVSDTNYTKLKTLSKRLKQPMKEVAGKLIDNEQRIDDITRY